MFNLRPGSSANLTDIYPLIQRNTHKQTPPPLLPNTTAAHRLKILHHPKTARTHRVPLSCLPRDFEGERLRVREMDHKSCWVNADLKILGHQQHVSDFVEAVSPEPLVVEGDVLPGYQQVGLKTLQEGRDAQAKNRLKLIGEIH